MHNLVVRGRNIGFFLLLVLLFLTSLNFEAKFYYFTYFSTIVMLISYSRFKINNTFVVYLFLGILMAGYSLDDGLLSAMRCLSYPIMFFVGLNASRPTLSAKAPQATDVHASRSRGYALLAIVALGAFAHYVLNFLINAGQDIGRNTFDIWTGTIMAATGQAALGCLMLGLSLAMILAPVKKYLRIPAIVSISVILAYNLTLAGRTIVVIFVILIVVGLYFENKNVSGTKMLTKVFLPFVFVLSAIYVLYVSNFAGIKDWLWESNFFQRFMTSADQSSGLFDSRLTRRIQFLQNAWKYPFGGLNMRKEFGLAHDLLLDAYDEYGIIALILLVIILITGLVGLLKMCRNRRIPLPYRMAFLCVYVSILSIFFVEPIFAGMPWLFVCYCLINGTIASINKTENDYDRRKPTDENLAD